MNKDFRKIYQVIKTTNEIFYHHFYTYLLTERNTKANFTKNDFEQAYNQLVNTHASWSMQAVTDKTEKSYTNFTTNNQMLLQAVVYALNNIKEKTILNRVEKIFSTLTQLFCVNFTPINTNNTLQGWCIIAKTPANTMPHHDSAPALLTFDSDFYLRCKAYYYEGTLESINGAAVVEYNEKGQIINQEYYIQDKKVTQQDYLARDETMLNTYKKLQQELNQPKPAPIKRQYNQTINEQKKPSSILTNQTLNNNNENTLETIHNFFGTTTITQKLNTNKQLKILTQNKQTIKKLAPLINKYNSTQT